jgi:hypothetical protein
MIKSKKTLPNTQHPLSGGTTGAFTVARRRRAPPRQHYWSSSFPADTVQTRDRISWKVWSIGRRVKKNIYSLKTRVYATISVHASKAQPPKNLDHLFSLAASTIAAPIIQNLKQHDRIILLPLFFMIYVLQTSKSRLQLYCIAENYPKKRQWDLKRDR